MNRDGDTLEPGAETPDFSENSEPFALFAEWMVKAEACEPVDPNAMALATTDAAGMPNVRMVLLKGADADGFVFYTNGESAKGLELAANPKASLLLYWKSLNRQVRIRGPVAQVSDEEADAYFASRHRASRIGAWASSQSRPLTSRAKLVADVAKETARFGVGEVPRPPLLARLSGHPARDRVLAGRHLPPARPCRVSAILAASALGQDAALSLD